MMKHNETNQVLEAVLPAGANPEKRKLFGEILKKPILSNGDLGTLFQIGERTLYNWREIYQLPHILLSGRYYYKLADILAFIESKYNTLADGTDNL